MNEEYSLRQQEKSRALLQERGAVKEYSVETLFSSG